MEDAKKLAVGLARTPQERDLLLHGGPVLEVIERRLRKHLEAVRKESEGEKDFTEPNWPEKQAYRLGQIKAYKTMLELLPKGDIYE